ncbi:AraC family transcriptional regulator [Vibrio sp. SCSIO 43136]|uniref:AraC family transcriptional regulator n=1 Tax=Vibrio sp. SCSIO 43136 TaxID=2819101 RepID=UPI00207662C3|nr:AraC family transcriptional regulator [Vibrio sp. SCSIO 43136]USD65872.1 helix-turn-helix transcriptional regulator [Vibrio sp. SCSIO 43136]
MKNQHKFKAKRSNNCDDVRQLDDYPTELSLNYSRTIGQSKNWIGSGFIVNRKGANGDHIEVKFPYYSLVYVVAGKGTYIDERGRTFALGAGSVFQRKPRVIHSTKIDPDSGWKEYYLDCNEELYEHLSAMSLVRKEVSVYSSHPDTTINSQIDGLMAQLQGATEDQVLDAYILYLSILRSLLTWQESECHSNDMIQLSLSDFETRFTTRFDIKHYCQEKGWGYEKFRKDFKAQLGVSPRDYLIRKRMDEACRLLRSSTLPISQIAAHLGYASPYEFSNQFSKTFSLAPKHFRQGV